MINLGFLVWINPIINKILYCVSTSSPQCLKTLLAFVSIEMSSSLFSFAIVLNKVFLDCLTPSSAIFLWQYQVLQIPVSHMFVPHIDFLMYFSREIAFSYSDFMHYYIPLCVLYWYLKEEEEHSINFGLNCSHVLHLCLRDLSSQMFLRSFPLLFSTFSAWLLYSQLISLKWYKAMSSVDCALQL